MVADGQQSKHSLDQHWWWDCWPLTTRATHLGPASHCNGTGASKRHSLCQWLVDCATEQQWLVALLLLHFLFCLGYIREGQRELHLPTCSLGRWLEVTSDFCRLYRLLTNTEDLDVTWNVVNHHVEYGLLCWLVKLLLVFLSLKSYR